MKTEREPIAAAVIESPEARRMFSTPDPEIPPRGAMMCATLAPAPRTRAGERFPYVEQHRIIGSIQDEQGEGVENDGTMTLS